MISVLTTIFAGVHGYFQQLDAKKSQLHTVLSQLNALSLQAAEMSFKYPAQPHALGSNFSAQNTVLADQAYSLVTSLGKSASATDINLVALALERNGNAALARRLLAGAVPRIADVLQYQTVHRHLGILSAVLGDQAGVDDEFKKAEGVFERFHKTQEIQISYFARNFIMRCNGLSRSLVSIANWRLPIWRQLEKC